MKNRTQLAFITTTVLVVYLLTGCLPSLQPLYTTDKLVLLNGLTGVWQAENGGTDQNGTSKKPEVWTFRKEEDKSYLLIHEDEDGFVAALDVHVVKLGSHYFMDFYPGQLPNDETINSVGKIVQDPLQMNSFLQLHLLAVHTFAKIELSAKKLKINMFDPDFLKNLLEGQQIRIKHEKIDDDYILTASSSDLQKFVEKYAEEEEAFLDDPMVLNLQN